MLALLNNPTELEKVRADPGLTANLIEEVVRFDGPINIATMMFTTEEIDVDGVVIPPNGQVLISLLSANRDAARFPDADRFDVERNARGHLASVTGSTSVSALRWLGWRGSRPLDASSTGATTSPSIAPRNSNTATARCSMA